MPKLEPITSGLSIVGIEPSQVVTISAEFPNGVSGSVKRAVSENATILGFKNKTWE